MWYLPIEGTSLYLERSIRLLGTLTTKSCKSYRQTVSHLSHTNCLSYQVRLVVLYNNDYLVLPVPAAPTNPSRYHFHKALHYSTFHSRTLDLHSILLAD